MTIHRTIYDTFDEILTSEEVCKILKTTRRTFYRLVTSKRLAAFKVGGDWRIKSSELVKFMERGSHRPSKTDLALAWAAVLVLIGNFILT